MPAASIFGLPGTLIYVGLLMLIASAIWQHASRPDGTAKPQNKQGTKENTFSVIMAPIQSFWNTEELLVMLLSPNNPMGGSM